MNNSLKLYKSDTTKQCSNYKICLVDLFVTQYVHHTFSLPRFFDTLFLEICQCVYTQVDLYSLEKFGNNKVKNADP